MIFNEFNYYIAKYQSKSTYYQWLNAEYLNIHLVHPDIIIINYSTAEKLNL